MIFSPRMIDDARYRIQKVIWNEPLSPDALEGMNQILVMLKYHENMNNNSR
jgi:hypothetical protein